jgi:DNA-directed RNA polymerase specialized sigma24 family protein
MKLLATMARNRLFDHARKQKAARRDIGRVEGGPIEDFAVPASEATPSRIVSAKELLVSARNLLKEDERDLVERRRNGEPWEEIALSTGRSAEALRKQYTRAIDRVSAQLGMGPFND